MTASTRPLRSVLYLPASNGRALDKARGLDIDAVILDLEDAVAPDAKPDARSAACRAVREGGFGHRVVAIRINGIGTQWHEDDMAAVAAAGPDAIVVPKVDSPADVEQLVAGMSAAPATTQLWAMLETPRAILDARAIAAASDRLTVLIMGTNDLVKELGARFVPGRAPLLASLGLAVLGAKAAGKAILDGVYNDVRDPSGFAAECRLAAEFGFDGKTLIHPNQVQAANDEWAPSAAQIDDARGLIATFEAALQQGQGVVTYQGRMIENLHVEQARRTLALAEAISTRQAQPADWPSGAPRAAADGAHAGGA